MLLAKYKPNHNKMIKMGKTEGWRIGCPTTPVRQRTYSLEKSGTISAFR